jgi:hypothetical protein
MNPNIDTNYLTNSLAKAQQFVKQTVSKMQSGIERKPWGSYQSEYGAVSPVVKQAVKQTPTITEGGTKYTQPSDVAAAAGLDVLTNASRRDIWRYTNMHRLMGDVGQHVAPRLGLDSPLAGAAVAAAVPVALGMMSGQIGPLTEGLRPKGYKAVAPVSKEEDPSGRKTRSAALEASLRYGLGQRSQLLPYQEFKQERPDVAPSTFVQYRRYQSLKPEAGKNVIVDPESQSFSALGGALRGTARGLNDPEIRLKGVPVTASAALGTAAGLGAIKALSSAITPKLNLEGKSLSDVGQRSINAGEKIAEKLGKYTDPTLLAAGAITAATVSQVAKKLFQKSAERRIKKENPVEYLKHKHGSLEQASTALGQPQAQSWQQLVPHIK